MARVRNHRRPVREPVRVRALVAAALLAPAVAVAPALLGPRTLGVPSTPSAAAEPTVEVTTVVSGLSLPWDLTWVGDTMLYTLRAGQVWSKVGSGAPQRVAISGFPSIFAQSEGGLLGMVADPAASTNRRFYTCQSVRDGAGNALDVRVLRWRLTSATTAVSDGAPVVTGIPLSSGRHSGCRLRFGGDGRLYVATGDAAVGSTPQDLSSLGGKVLRVGWDGSIPADNPFVSRGGRARYVWTYGHRNLQGLALRPGTSELWTAEHGPDRDDEVNLVVRGANYGWNPVPGYNETVPMTDTAEFPAARTSMWSSGSPTVATSGTTFLSGAAWGEWRGSLAVALLKGQGVLLMRFHPTAQPSRVAAVTRLPQTEGLGRIRTVQQGPDGALWVATSNGSGNDRIVRIAPRASAPAVAAGRLVSSSGVTVARTGREVTAFVRTTGDLVYLRRSTDDGTTWSRWVNGTTTTTTAPSAASSAGGRFDLVARSASGSVVHSWYTGGVRRGSTDLGGQVIAQHVTSMAPGTLDVFAVAPNGVGYRKRFDGTRWGRWTSVGGTFTSGLSASADPATRTVLVTGRGTNGVTYEQVFSATGGSGRWVPRGDGLSGWSDRALGDLWPRQSRLAVGAAPDARAVVQRGAGFVTVRAVWNAAPDVVSRSDGTFLMVGRGTDGGLWVYDGRPGGFLNRSLGGVVL